MTEDNEMLISFLGAVAPEIKKIDSMVLDKKPANGLGLNLDPRNIMAKQLATPIPQNLINKQLNEMLPSVGAQVQVQTPATPSQIKAETKSNNQLEFDFMNQIQEGKNPILDILVKINDNLAKNHREVLNYLKDIKNSCIDINILLDRKKRKKVNNAAINQ